MEQIGTTQKGREDKKRNPEVRKGKKQDKSE